jgi:hypothetical protein
MTEREIITGLIDKLIDQQSIILYDNDYFEKKSKTLLSDEFVRNNLKHFSEKQKTRLLKLNVYECEYFDNMTQEEREICYMEDGKLVDSFYNEMTQEELVKVLLRSKTNGENAYKYLDEKMLTKELALKVMQKYPSLWKYIPLTILSKEEKKEGIKMYFRKNNSFVIDKGFENLDEENMSDKELLMCIVENTKGYGLKYIPEKDRTEEMEMRSLELSQGTSLQYIKNPTVEQRMKALSYHWDIYHLLENPTEEETMLYNELKLKIKGLEIPRFLTKLKFGNNFGLEQL